MSRKINIINNILSMAVTIVLVFLVSYICNQRYTDIKFAGVIALFVVGAIISGFICTLLHELGHVVFGKKNGFEFVSMTVWFFKWYKTKKKTRFDFVMMGDAGGFTEMVAKDTENLKKRFYKMTLGGSVFTAIAMLIGVIPFVVTKTPSWVFCIVSMFLPVGAYILFGNILPMSTYGARNDGGVLYGLKKDDDDSKVVIALQSIQSELFNGKRPSEIDEDLYFNLPQLPEDDLNFILLLNSRYIYYLDKADYENAKKTIDHMVELSDNLSSYYSPIIKTEALYASCTFDFNEQNADDYMYEVEKYVNRVNNADTVRAKLAYLVYIKHDTSMLEVFYKKGIRESNRCRFSGLGEFYKTLYNKIKADCEKEQNE